MVTFRGIIRYLLPPFLWYLQGKSGLLAHLDIILKKSLCSIFLKLFAVAAALATAATTAEDLAKPPNLYFRAILFELSVRTSWSEKLKFYRVIEGGRFSCHMQDEIRLKHLKPLRESQKM